MNSDELYSWISTNWMSKVPFDITTVGGLPTTTPSIKFQILYSIPDKEAYFWKDGSWSKLPNSSSILSQVPLVSNSNDGILSKSDYISFKGSSRYMYGFEDLTQVLIAFDIATLTLTVSPKTQGGSFRYYISGDLNTVSTSVSKTISNTSGMYYFAFDTQGNIVVSNTSYQNDFSKLEIAFLRFDATGNKLTSWNINATSNFIVSPIVRAYLLKASPIYVSGFDITTNSGNGTLDNEYKFGLGNGSFQIIEKKYNIVHTAVPTNSYENILSPNCNLRIFYKSGAGDILNSFDVSDVPLVMFNNKIQYNSYDGASWGLSDVGNNSYVSVFLFCGIDARSNCSILGILGERTDNSLSNAKSNNTPNSITYKNFNLNNAKLLYRLIFYVSSAYTNICKARIVHVEDYRNLENVFIGNNFNKNLLGLGNVENKNYSNANNIVSGVLPPTVKRSSAIRTVNTNYTISVDDEIINVDTINNTIQILLPNATNITGRRFLIRNSGNNLVVIKSSVNTQMINNDNSIVLNYLNSSITLISSGIDYFVE